MPMDYLLSDINYFSFLPWFIVKWITTMVHTQMLPTDSSKEDASKVTE
jgi:hypothetical protein